MKNYERYKTPEERLKAYKKYIANSDVKPAYPKVFYAAVEACLAWLNEEYEPKGLRCCPICGKWSKIEKHTTFSLSRHIKCPHCGGLAIEQCWHHNYT